MKISLYLHKSYIFISLRANTISIFFHYTVYLELLQVITKHSLN